MIRRYFTMLVAEGYADATGKMKQFASWFTHGVEGGAKLRKAIYEAKSAGAIVEAVDIFFNRPEAECIAEPAEGDGECSEASCG
jgi:tRNA-dihydrouridine synthase